MTDNPDWLAGLSDGTEANPCRKPGRTDAYNAGFDYGLDGGASEIERLDAGWAKANREVLRLNLENEALRARVAGLETSAVAYKLKHVEIGQELLDTQAELAALKAGNGVPVPVAVIRTGFKIEWCAPHYGLVNGKAVQHPDGTKLYTQAPTIPEPVMSAIGSLLEDGMAQAVANGANSVSMPDEYVEVAAWLCGIPPQAPTRSKT